MKGLVPTIIGAAFVIWGGYVAITQDFMPGKVYDNSPALQEINSVDDSIAICANDYALVDDYVRLTMQRANMMTDTALINARNEHDAAKDNFNRLGYAGIGALISFGVASSRRRGKY